jgi:hypothetical protein
MAYSIEVVTPTHGVATPVTTPASGVEAPHAVSNPATATMAIPPHTFVTDEW